MQKSYIIIASLLVISIAGFSWYTLSSSPALVACTMEAQLCPDGSSVGRTGPNCEFATCPTITSGWKTFTDTARGISFTYPDPLPTKYISTQEWPPVIVVTSGALSCAEKKIMS